MKRLPWLLTWVVLAAACTDTTAPAPTGSDAPRLAVSHGMTRCTGTLPPGTYQNITVPEEAVCVVENSTVLRNVTARRGSRLTLVNVRVGESVHGLKAAAVHIYGGGSVGDNIHIHGADSPNQIYSVYINGTEVTRGDIQIESNNAGGIGVLNNSVVAGSIVISDNDAVLFNTIQDNRVGQNVTVTDNRGPGPKAVNNNFVGGRVSCFRNDGPFLGGPNFAQSADGDCF
jgi:hypothetical protein